MAISAEHRAAGDTEVREQMARLAELMIGCDHANQRADAQQDTWDSSGAYLGDARRLVRLCESLLSDARTHLAAAERFRDAISDRLAEESR